MLIGDALDPTYSGRGRQGRIPMVCCHVRVRTVSQEKPHQLGIARLRRAYECRGTRFKEPLHGKDGSCERVVFHPGVRIRPVVEKRFDVFEMIQVRLRYWKIPALDVSVVCGE